MSRKNQKTLENQPKAVQKMVKELAEATGNSLETAYIAGRAWGDGNDLMIGFKKEHANKWERDPQYCCYPTIKAAKNAGHELNKGNMEADGVWDYDFEDSDDLDECVKVEWFKKAQRDYAKSYVSGMKKTNSERYTQEFGKVSINDAVKQCLAKWGDNLTKWYISEFGNDKFLEVIHKNNLMDFGKLASHYDETPGDLGFREYELPCGYYCYEV